MRLGKIEEDFSLSLSLSPFLLRLEGNRRRFGGEERPKRSAPSCGDSWLAEFSGGGDRGCQLLKTFPQTGTNLSKCRSLPPPPTPASRYGNFGWMDRSTFSRRTICTPDVHYPMGRSTIFLETSTSTSWRMHKHDTVFRQMIFQCG